MKNFSGKVVQGEKRGRLLGFPTINLDGIYDLPFGVYASRVVTPYGTFKGALHYGPRPVFGDMKAVMEIYLLDFNEDLYGAIVTVEILKKLREVEKFKSIQELKQQIEKDVEMVRQDAFHE